jgi:hypothetical protein
VADGSRLQLQAVSKEVAAMSVFWTMQSVMENQAEMGAAAAGRTAARRTEELDDRLDRTLLACEAMWSILREKLGVTDVDLVERFNQLDLTDGKLDGKVRKAPVSCPKCGRAMSRRLTKCMYCGQPVVHDPFV